MDVASTLQMLEALKFKEKRILSPLRKCIKKLSFKSSRDLTNLSDLGMWLYIYGHTDQALKVCELAARVEFAGDFIIWTPVENLLLLGARIHREQGHKAEADTYAKRVAQPMAVHGEALKRRLSFNWLSDKSIERCLQDNDLRAANEWRFSDLSSLFLMRELGKGRKDIDGYKVDTARAEAKIVEYLEILKTAR